jgi:hypothetical protein
MMMMMMMMIIIILIIIIIPSGAHIVGTGSDAPKVLELPCAWGYSWATRPQGDINSGDWSSRLGVGRKASDLTLENISCCEVSNRDSRMDLSNTTFITSKDNGNGSYCVNLECSIYAPGRKVA